MNNSHIPLSRTDVVFESHTVKEQEILHSSSPTEPPVHEDGNGLIASSSFWRECLWGVGIILSMTLFYLIGNHEVEYPIGDLGQLNSLLAWPFFLAFVVLCWFRLRYALAFLPLALPYYLQQKVVMGNTRFSPAEIVLWTCLLIAFIQFCLGPKKWRYRISLAEFRDRLGPFIYPIAVFVATAFISIFVASALSSARDAFRLEVFDPLLYAGLIFCCLRGRWDLVRLLGSLFATGLIIAFFAIIDNKLFGLADAVYGSPNSVGLLFDYTLPIGLALLFSRLQWKMRLLSFFLCLPFCYALLNIGSNGDASRGTTIAAFPAVLLFVILLAIRNRKVLLVSSAIVIVLIAGGYGIFHNKVNQLVVNNVINGHEDVNHVSTLQRRFYLWESALAMIHDSPWIGYGMDNWLCHYANPHLHYFDSSGNPVTLTNWTQVCRPVSHYYMVSEVNGKPTHMTDEPNLSHPHNIFLQICVSIGFFGLLAFVALLVFFFRLFSCLLIYLSRHKSSDSELFRWMAVSVTAAMIGILIQGLVDSSFLEQDLSFCFWILVATLLMLRFQIGMPWKTMLHPRLD